MKAEILTDCETKPLFNFNGLHDKHPKIAGYDTIMVIVCRLNKWSVFVPCSKQAMTEKVVQLFFNNCVRYKKFLLDILCDHGLLFEI